MTDETPKWIRDARIEIMKERDGELTRMSKLSSELKATNGRINELEKQLTCNHEMKSLYKAGAFGGLDIDVCIHCGYEYIY